MLGGSVLDTDDKTAIKTHPVAALMQHSPLGATAQPS